MRLAVLALLVICLTAQDDTQPLCTYSITQPRRMKLR